MDKYDYEDFDTMEEAMERANNRTQHFRVVSVFQTTESRSQTPGRPVLAGSVETETWFTVVFERLPEKKRRK